MCGWVGVIKHHEPFAAPGSQLRVQWGPATGTFVPGLDVCLAGWCQEILTSLAGEEGIGVGNCSFEETG